MEQQPLDGLRDGSKKVLWRKLNMVNIEKQHETLRLKSWAREEESGAVSDRDGKPPEMDKGGCEWMRKT